MYDFFLKIQRSFLLKKIQFFHARNITYKNLVFKFSIELRDDATRRSIYSAYYVYIQCRDFLPMSYLPRDLSVCLDMIPVNLSAVALPITETTVLTGVFLIGEQYNHTLYKQVGFNCIPR